MKILSLTARLLLGIAFTVFGLNGFLHFIHMPPPPDGPATQYMTALAGTHYLQIVFAIQLLCGILFLVGSFVALALTLIGPVIVNILLFHALMEPSGIVNGLVVTVLWLIVFYYHREAFAGIFRVNA